MLASLQAFEGIGIFAGLTLQDLCKLQTVSSEVKGHLHMQGFAWKAAASRALPFLDLSAELFREANLRQCLQALPLFLKPTAAEHSIAVLCASKSTVEMLDRKQQLKTPAEVKNLAEELQLALASLRRRPFAKVFLSQMEWADGRSFIMLPSCKMGQVFATLRLQFRLGQAQAVRVGEGKLMLALTCRAARESEAPPEMLLDFSGSNAAGLSLRFRGVRLRVNGPWKFATTLPARHATQTEAKQQGPMSCVMCLRDTHGPPATTKSLQALNIDHLAWRIDARLAQF
ncbi:unnamed protein product [Effrenium voratum]|uniref:Uncharacterized protein n=1 Tax=Effrenium voratum TaxID=2562239 RepID=A0AA36I6H5_9DINO|nr:unnamed protein product [Effrenium voratum]CAJ1381981.1 unnamed protein product [Effrenium voratum]